MGAYPVSHSKKLHGKPVSKVEVARDVVEPELNPHSTEAIARQLLNPAVSEEEEEEYQGYVILCLVSMTTYGIYRYIDQCQELVGALVERKDLAVYQTAVRTAAGDSDGQDDVVEDAFIAYVERGTTQYLDRKEALPVAFNYDRWIGGVGQRI